MREIKTKKAFRQDVKRVDGSRYRLIAKHELWDVVDSLANDIPLLWSYKDHALHGNWEGSRECHIRPDLLLVYTYVDDDWLILERLGSHSEIFGL